MAKGDTNISKPAILVDGDKPIVVFTLPMNLDGEAVDPAGVGIAVMVAAFVGGATAATTSVASATSSGPIIAANPARKTVVIVNDSTADLYLRYGAGTASLTTYTHRLGPNDEITVSGWEWIGDITGIWSAVNGNARVTETTA